MKVSLICTVKNEGEALRPLLDSLVSQSRPPNEIVFCDGGSTDDTIEVLREYQEQLPILVVVAAGSNISQGRNQAISAAAGPIIASVDAGVLLSPNWLEELVVPIEEEGARVVSGWFEPDPKTRFEVVMGATVLPALGDIEPEKFLPSSRSIAYLKSAWQDVGGYPKWLDYGEDLIFDLALRERFGPFPFSPKAVAYFRPREDLQTYARQYYLYARGDGKAGLWPKRHGIRYLTYFAGLPLLAALICRRNLLGWALLAIGGGVYCRRPAQRLWPQIQDWPKLQQAKALALIPIIRLVGDIAKMVGYPVGILWRRRIGLRLPQTQSGSDPPGEVG